MSFTAIRQISAYCITLTCILCLAAPARAQVLEQDSLALVAFYNSTNGPGWANTWDLNTLVSTWYGVTVSGGRVTQLNLGGNNLSGSIPAELGSLINLTELYLSYNQLTGPIPSEIGNLTSLTYLNLSSNQLTGPIPPEIGSLTSLRYLFLYNNQLTGPIPAEIGSLTSLYSMILTSNQLTGSIPTSIGNLTSLGDLFLQNNKFTDLPDLNTLLALEYLYIGNNQLTFEDIEYNVGVPYMEFTYAPQDSVGTEQDTSVVEGASLTLSIAVGGTANQYQWLKDGTDIAGAMDDTLIIAPVSLADAGSYILRTTNTIATELTLYSRPVHVTALTPLQADSLALVALYDSTGGPGWNNTWDLSSPVSTWHGVTVSGDRVARLYLSTNNLSGPIPAEIGSLTSLTDLHLGSNQLTGPIPAEIVNLTGLGVLDLNNNQLTSTIPAAIGSLTNLTDLLLYNNQLTGPIPAAIGNLTSLTYLNIADNQLTGPMPAWIGNLTSLQEIWLFNNQLTGPIPAAIGSLNNLTHLNLYKNQLTGPIPLEICSLTGLIHLHLSWNQLTGSVPAGIGSLTSLTSFSLSDNQLTGPIPSEIGNLTSLKYLELEHNQLTGPIPAEIGSLTNLTRLYLYDNQLVDLPDLSSLLALQYLSIYGNQFTFEDIEPNLGAASTEFSYAPQDSVGIEKDTTVYANDSLTLAISVGGTANLYQWMKDGVDISGATSDPYTLSNIQFADSGDYNLRITNTIATDLTLYSRPIHVTVPNSPPVAMADSVTTSEDTALTIFVLVNDADPDGDTLTVVSVTQPAHGAAAIDAGDTTLTYTPNANFWGVDSLTYTVSDGKSGLDTATVMVTVTSVNDPPITFMLVSPGHDSTLVITSANLGDTLTFAWEGAVDVDGDTVRYGAELTDGLGALLTFGDTTATEVRLPYAAVVAIMEGLEQLTLTGTWDIFAADGEDTTWASNGPFTFTVDATTLDLLRQALLPDQFALHQNYPNPFNPSTTVRFDLPEATEIHLVLYDLMGREVIHLVDGRREAGYYRVVWNGRDARGREVPTGLYIVRLLAPTYTRSIKLVLLK